ncbi:class I tRNA ligase family protein [Cupriavidus basilensis]
MAKIMSLLHHSNEIAQTQAAHGTRLANFWMHGHFLTLDADTKMSKSSGDFVRLQTLQRRNIDPVACRYLCLTAHYRSQLHFSWASLDAAQNSVEPAAAPLFPAGPAEAASIQISPRDSTPK